MARFLALLFLVLLGAACAAQGAASGAPESFLRELLAADNMTEDMNATTTIPQGTPQDNAGMMSHAGPLALPAVVPAFVAVVAALARYE
mmetsp:Transcript_68825/g.154112  ORF Transcript_68825/g.154112 Transcript_68825/m.154112 type:complete len:89 (+) Transcript_68825:107-373(+)